MAKTMRMLVINDQSLERENATGITLRSILKDWDPKLIMELYIDPKDQACANKAEYRTKCIIDCFPLQKLVRSNRKNAVASNGTVNQQKKNGKVALIQRIRRTIINICDCSSFVMIKEVKEEIEQFHPDIIYTLAGSVAVMKAATVLSIKYNIPIVIHFMDDWAHYLQINEGIEQKLYHAKMKSWLHKIHKRTNVNLTISPLMAREYEKETHIKHVPLMNSVDISGLQCTETILSNPIRLVYAGGLHLQRWEALLEISETLPMLEQQFGRRFTLSIYTNMDSAMGVSESFDPRYVTFYEYVPHDDIKNVFEQSDILVHVETTAPEMQGFFRFSISTKIPEYLSTSRSFIFYGPKNIGLYAYLKDNQVAFVSSTKDEFMKAVCQLINNPDEARAMRERAIAFVAGNHEINACREVFKRTMGESLENASKQRK